ncbi:MAG: AI-2E family transporter [Pyrinomonadaceae bacterium]
MENNQITNESDQSVPLQDQTQQQIGQEFAWAQSRAILRVLFIVLAVAGVLWVIYTLKSIILLIVLAIFFAYLIAPLVDLLQKPFHFGGRESRLPRPLAIGMVYILVFGALALSIFLLSGSFSRQFTAFIQEAPQYLNNTRTRARSLQEIYKRMQLPPAAADYVTKASQSAIDSAENFVREGFGGVLGILSYVPWLVLIPILAFFFLKDAEQFREAAVKALPRGRLRWRGDEFFEDVNHTLAAYIRAQLTACFVVGVLCTVGFMIIGVPYALVFGLVAGLFEFIPLAGPLVVLLLTAIVTGFSSVPAAFAVVAFLIVLRGVEDYVIYPRIIGHGIHLHPLAIVLAILCGDQIAGLTGIFLAIPVVAVIAVAYRHWIQHRGSRGLVADLLQPVETLAAPTLDLNAAQATTDEMPSPSPPPPQITSGI